jgi:multidrug resistance efflux pump
VKKIPDHVREGATVNAGDVLVEFDPAQFVHQKGQADHAHTAALWTADQAAKKRNDHKLELKKAALAVEKADGDLKSAREFRDSTSEALEETLRLKDLAKGAVLDEEEKAIRRKRNVELQKAEVAVRHADLAVRAAKLDEERLTAASAVVEADVSKANAQVAVVQAQIDQATAVIESFKLRAQVTGTVEQITVAEGMTVGPATRTPLMYLIPNGPRVVRAEVEAEFAHKIDAFLGKTVTIYDAHNFTNTYTGVAKRVNRAFLPKRFGGDSLVNAPTRSLECTIEVSDPAPPGKPPLRPGQPVRVTFGN